MGAAVVGTGRSDFPNQINNVLVFPGLFKGPAPTGPCRSPRHEACRRPVPWRTWWPRRPPPTCISALSLNRAAAGLWANAVAAEARRTGHARF